MEEMEYNIKAIAKFIKNWIELDMSEYVHDLFNDVLLCDGDIKKSYSKSIRNKRINNEYPYRLYKGNGYSVFLL